MPENDHPHLNVDALHESYPDLHYHLTSAHGSTPAKRGSLARLVELHRDLHGWDPLHRDLGHERLTSEEYTQLQDLLARSEHHQQRKMFTMQCEVPDDAGWAVSIHTRDNGIHLFMFASQSDVVDFVNDHTKPDTVEISITQVNTPWEV